MPVCMSEHKGVRYFPSENYMFTSAICFQKKNSLQVTDRQRPRLLCETLKSKQESYWPHINLPFCIINFHTLNLANCVGVGSSARSCVSCSEEVSEHEETEREKNSR